MICRRLVVDDIWSAWLRAVHQALKTVRNFCAGRPIIVTLDGDEA